MTDTIISQFADREHGGFFYTAADHEPLLVHKIDCFDSPTPSGNGLAAMLLLRLQAVTAGHDYRVAAEAAIRACDAWMRQVPTAVFQLLLAIEADSDSSTERGESVLVHHSHQ